jgi:hypothetical protein
MFGEEGDIQRNHGVGCVRRPRLRAHPELCLDSCGEVWSRHVFVSLRQMYCELS